MKEYSDYKDINSGSRSNKKTHGSNIVPCDTIRGCTNNCISCYGLNNASYRGINFRHPVRCKLTGIPEADKIYRFGEYGDPSTDWAHTWNQIDAMIDKGMQNFYFITKLQSLKGFRYGSGRTIQVSIDSINQSHYRRTMRNVRILHKKGERLVLRIKSLLSHDKAIMRRLDSAVRLADKLGLPILETPWRFASRLDCQKAKLFMGAYTWKANHYQTKPFIIAGDNTYKTVCDEAKSGCASCRNCELFATRYDSLKV